MVECLVLTLCLGYFIFNKYFDYVNKIKVKVKKKMCLALVTISILRKSYEIMISNEEDPFYVHSKWRENHQFNNLIKILLKNSIKKWKFV